MTYTLPDVNFQPLMPMLFVLLGAIVSTIGAFNTKRIYVTWFNIAMLVCSGLAMTGLLGYGLWNRDLTAFSGGVRADNVALMIGGVIVIGSIMSLLVSLDTAWRARVSFPEFDAILMYAIVGCLLIAFSGDLIVMLIGLEIMSLAGYVLATLQDSRRSEESGLKYFLLGSVGSAILIYGIAFLYGATGSFNYANIAGRVAEVLNPATVTDAANAANAVALAPNNLGILVAGALLILSGFAFKVALAPFHQWTPDVYSGAPTSISLFLSTVIKVAAFAGMLRIFNGALVDAPAWHSVLQWLIAITLIIGNMAAYFQTNFKRLMAYSAVAHTGFLAMCLLAQPSMGGPALVYYLLTYTLMSGVVFAIIAALQRNERGLNIGDMRGLFYRHPAYAVALAVCLASLAGLPPFAGFFSKYLAFQAAFQNGYQWLTVLAAITSVISLVYYLRPAMLMFMPDRTPAREYQYGQRPPTNATVALGVLGVILLGLIPSLWYNFAANPQIWRLLAGIGQ